MFNLLALAGVAALVACANADSPLGPTGAEAWGPVAANTTKAPAMTRTAKTPTCVQVAPVARMAQREAGGEAEENPWGAPNNASEALPPCKCKNKPAATIAPAATVAATNTTTAPDFNTTATPAAATAATNTAGTGRIRRNATDAANSTTPVAPTDKICQDQETGDWFDAEEGRCTFNCVPDVEETEDEGLTDEEVVIIAAAAVAAAGTAAACCACACAASSASSASGNGACGKSCLDLFLQKLCNPQTWIQCTKDQAQKQIEKRLSQRVRGSTKNAKNTSEGAATAHEQTFDTFE